MTIVRAITKQSRAGRRSGATCHLLSGMCSSWCAENSAAGALTGGWAQPKLPIVYFNPLRRRTSSNIRRGFTLIELILIMVLLAIVASAVVPSLGRFSRSRQNQDVAEQLVSIIQYAQNQAASTGYTYRFQLDPVAGTYWLVSNQSGSYARPTDNYGRTFSIGSGLTAQWDATTEIATRGYLEFAPDGGHDVAIVRLSSHDGDVILIGCASVSEPYHIGGPDDRRVEP